MRKVSLSTRIEQYLKGKGWVHKSEIETFVKDLTYVKKGRICHYLADQGCRRLRELAEEGKIERDITRDGYYRHKDAPIKQQRVIVINGVARVYYE